jgi:hypothetical protein
VCSACMSDVMLTKSRMAKARRSVSKGQLCEGMGDEVRGCLSDVRILVLDER